MGKGAGRRRRDDAEGGDRYGGAERESLSPEQLGKRRRGTWIGCGMIAFGLVSAVYNYFSDADSMDFSRMVNAGDFSILHAVLWTVAGAAVIFWYSGPGIAPPAGRDGDER
jgi:hypothetical protein